MEKILLIDDDEDLTTIVKTILTANGFAVHIHSTGVNVPEVVHEYHPDLILIDILLYGKPGTEICKELKRIYSVPIILFSGDMAKGEAFQDCDADGFIGKPFEVYDLVEKIKSHLKYGYNNHSSLN